MGEQLSSGIEHLLALAAADPAVAARLLDNRQAVLATGAVRLTPAEEHLLKSVDDRRLELMIASVRRAATPADPARRALLSGAAATLLGALSGCSQAGVTTAAVESFRREVQAGGGGITGIRPGTGGFGFRRRAGPWVSVRQTQLEVTQGLSREIVRRILRRHINELKYCFESKVGLEPRKEPVTLTVAFAIHETGKVASSRLVSCSIEKEAFTGCAVRAVRRWLFPKPRGGKTVKVTYGLSFTVVHPKQKKKPRK